MSNIYNGIIQTILKSNDKKVLGFIDTTKPNNPTIAVTLGPWSMSDALLRDENTVIAVKVQDNKIYRANISMSYTKIIWDHIPHDLSKAIEGIEIKDKYVQGSAGGEFFIIPLFENKEMGTVIQNRPGEQSKVYATTSLVRIMEDGYTWHPNHIIILVIAGMIFLLFTIIFITCFYYMVINSGMNSCLKKPVREEPHQLLMPQREVSLDEIQNAFKVYNDYKNNIRSAGSSGLGNTSTWDKSIEQHQRALALLHQSENETPLNRRNQEADNFV